MDLEGVMLSNSDRERQMWNLTNKMNKQNRNGLIDTEQTDGPLGGGLGAG